MRQLNTEGLSREALEVTYEIVLMQKLAYEAKLERTKKELSVAACAVADGFNDLEQIERGLLNTVAYLDAKTNIEDELDVDKKSIEVVRNQSERIKENIKRKKRSAWRNTLIKWLS